MGIGQNETEKKTAPDSKRRSHSRGYIRRTIEGEGDQPDPGGPRFTRQGNRMKDSVDAPR